MATYRVGDVVIFAPVNGETCYSPVVRDYHRWPDPRWMPNHWDARPGDRMEVIHIDQVAGQQRLWYRSIYSPYGPAPDYETPNPGEWGAHNVLACNVRLSVISRIGRFFAKESKP